MGKLIESTFVTLDGVINDPQVWGSPYWDEQHQGYAMTLLEPAESLLLGRETYEAFAETWPSMAGNPYADKVNAMPKQVASRTLTDATWNASIIDGDVADAVRRVKEEQAGDILKFGTGELDKTLLEAGLIDELHLWVFPVIAGSGERLLDGVVDPTHFTLAGTDVFDSGIVVHVLTPKPTE
jgi:dihydrofolate reductase